MKSRVTFGNISNKVFTVITHQAVILVTALLESINRLLCTINYCVEYALVESYLCYNTSIGSTIIKFHYYCVVNLGCLSVCVFVCRWARVPE